MTLSRFLAALAVLAAVETATFVSWNWDLVYLSQPRSSLVAATDGAFRANAYRALKRERLIRRHLESIADVSAERRDKDLHLVVLRRLATEYPTDAGVLQRFGDALRLAGRFDEAERVYRRVLAAGPGPGKGGR